jgi:predicted ATPase
MFKEEEFPLKGNVVIAGPNNSGKTTLIQALALWNYCQMRWLLEKGTKPAQYGLSINRKELSTVPVKEFNLLWTNRSTALRKEDNIKNKKPGSPRFMEILVYGDEGKNKWKLGFEFSYRYPDIIFFKPAESTPVEAVSKIIPEVRVTTIPPFSGIDLNEPVFNEDYQKFQIGLGKPGDVLRNVLLELHRDQYEKWVELNEMLRNIFQTELLPPEYSGRPFIDCEYININDKIRLDLMSAGTGFLQVVLLFGLIYSKPTSILLIDEPDAHLHVILQKQVLENLNGISRRYDCQVIISTHSEIIINEVEPTQLLSLYGKPHPLISVTEKQQAIEAIKRLDNLDLLLIEQAPGILYLEGETDFNILKEFARVLNHKLYAFFQENPFWKNNQGRNPREAKGHLFGLQSKKRGFKGVLLLDGDNRNLPDQEISAEGLQVLRWKRYEIENYLVQPKSLLRFVNNKLGPIFKSNAEDILKNSFPPTFFKNPLEDTGYLLRMAASKEFLPQFFDSLQVRIEKSEYYHIAAQMRPEEIHPEIKEKLDIIYKFLYEEL